MMFQVPCTAIVTAFQRLDQTLVTLEKIRACRPCPNEILVHVDCGGDECLAAVMHAFPEIRILCSDKTVGPGGARNKLIAAAKNDIIVSFDDDSYPIDADYFFRVAELFRDYPDAVVLAASISHRGQTPPLAYCLEQWVATFTGCGCAYRRSAFLQIGGYVPLKIAYHMEEDDLALRIHACGGYRILHSRFLRVFHDTNLSHQLNAKITGGSIKNIALRAWLRYPPHFWLLGCAQITNRIFWLVSHGRFAGIASGVFGIIPHLCRHSKYRAVVPAGAVRLYRKLLTYPVPAHVADVTSA